MPKMEIQDKKYQIGNRRYLGSKTRLLSFIHETIEKENIKFDSFCDIFGGTGSVANSFNDKNHKIIVNDILECNRSAFNAFFGSEEINVNTLKNIIITYNKIDVVDDNYFSTNFADTFFSLKNCRKIGFIRQDIDDRFNSKAINQREKDYLITSLLYSMDRIANTVGHYDAFRRGGDLDKELVLCELDVADIETNLNNQIFKKDANLLASEIVCDVVYIDPPYNSRQYCDAYHLLENVAQWKKPTVYGVARKMDRSSLKSKYCENTAPRVFDDLIKKLNCKYIIVSYNNMGLKGAGRSQAKITDLDIIRSLESKGKVEIYETEFNQFTTGKSEYEDHKERLFVCSVGVFEKQDKIKINEFVKSPLNYTGGKYKLLDSLMPKFPSNFTTFVDLFSGGFNVGANIECQKVVYNDISEEIMRLVKLFYKFNSNEIIAKLDFLIKKYKLSDSDSNGYEFYNCNSNNGLGSYNKKFFAKLRDDYNNSRKSIEKDFLFLLLTIYAFNNQIRFNGSGLYNMPVGKRDLNASMRKNIKLFSEKLKNRDIEFNSVSFEKIDFRKYENPFFYCDPPYLLGTASYNENGGWNEEKEIKLLGFLKLLSDNGIKFALSNVIEHKGMQNKILLNWALKNRFNINYLNKNYSNSSYHLKDKEQKTVEVLITNY